MSTPVCRVCLGSGMRMLPIEDPCLLDLFEKLSNTKLTGDGSPHTLCYVCAAQLRRSAKFAAEACRAEKFLKDLVQSQMEVTRETVASLNIGISQNLSFHTLKSTSFDGYSIDFIFEIMNELVEKQEKSPIASPKHESSYLFGGLVSSTRPQVGPFCVIHTHESSYEMDLPAEIKKNYNCDVCKKHCITKRELITHLKSHDIKSKKRTALCKVCNKEFSNPKSLKQHESIHTGAKPYVCKECGTAFRLKQSLHHHKVIQHSREKRFTCDVCNKSFFFKNGLAKHKQSLKCHSRSYEPYTCRTCHSTFKEHNELREHRQTHIGERRYGCNKCDKTFTQDSYLRSHIKHVHSTAAPYSCHRCSKKYKRFKSLEIHMKIHTKEPLLECKVCSVKFLHIASLKRHTRRHEGGLKKSSSDEYLYCCDRCNKKFKCKDYLKIHFRTHTGEKPFACETCGKRFSTSGSLGLHMIIHSDEKTCCCEICGKSFSRTSILRYHRQVHIEVKPYSCDRCEMKFSFKCAMMQHIKRMHTEVKAFACKQCGRSYDLESQLERHLSLHTVEHIYSCEICHKKYKRADVLQRHIKTHSTETPYACDRCNKAFKLKKYLKRHIERSATCRAISTNTAPVEQSR